MTSSTVPLLREDQWEIDPLFKTFPKLFIRDVLSMPPYPTAPTDQVHGNKFTGAFNYNNHPIINTDVMGIIVNVHKRDKCNIYDLDDGTGVVSCLCWLHREVHPAHSGQGQGDCDLPAELLQKLGQAEAACEKLVEGFKLGDLLHVRGKIKMYDGARELMCSFHDVEEDANAEALRIVEMVKCYKNFYDKPLVLPQDRDGSNNFDIKTDSLRLLVKSYFEEKGLELVSVDDIQKIFKQECETADVVTESTTKQVLENLMEGGIVYKSASNRDYYHVTDNNLDLHNATLKVLEKECRKSKYHAYGCPTMHILDELRALLSYIHLQRATVSRVLQILEENSEVICLEPHHYQVLDV